VSVWAKKFKQMLEQSEENSALKDRVTALEDQLEKMSYAFGNVMKSYVDLAKITVDNRKTLEEVLAYITNVNADDDVFNDEIEVSPEELAERKRMMN